MKPIKILRLIAIISYLVIILSGEMIAMPFILWLIFTAMGGLIQEKLMALGAITAIVVLLIAINKQRSIKMLILDVLCFLLMLAPIVGRFVAVPLSMFNYACFLVPFVFFVLASVITIFISLKNLLDLRGTL